MLTIFTTPKPFKGHSGIIQRNAIKSWALLQPRPQVIVFGNEEGTEQIAAELNVTQVAKVECSENGTPLISSMFNIAQQMSPNPLVCYVNADIMLTSDFMKALHAVHSVKPQFVMTGRRTLVDVQQPWNFDEPNWEATLRKYASTGKLDNWVAMDYFAFPRGVYADVPPFVVGRARWDNWVIYSARRRGIAVVEATHDVLAIHQNHDYGHLAGGVKDCFTNVEGLRNQALYGLKDCMGTLDSTHLLKNGKVRRALERPYLSRRLDTFVLLHPTLAPLIRPLLAARELTKGLRHRLLKPSGDSPTGSSLS